MATIPEATGALRNALLSKLTPELRATLRLEPVDLPVNLVLYEPDQPIEFAYFPELGAISVVSLMENGSIIEVGTIGNEGMACSVLLLETTSVPYRYFVQVAGHGYRVAAARLISACKANPELRQMVLRYESRFRVQTMQGMACNGLHSVEQRCCRWLLMTRDRVDSDEIKLTHEFLGIMLGVRRASVSDVLGPLQDAGLVRSQRGTISILDRKGLEKRVCECYAIMADRDTEAAAS